jgi:Ala-tRNA(Pro) deacylase
MKNIYEILKSLDIAYDLYEHPAVFTVEEADLVCGKIPGKQAKNLFLTNEKGNRHFLVTIAHEKRADLAKLAALFGEKRLRFASPERLQKHLGLTPGSVSPLGLINDTAAAVEFFIDRDLIEQGKIYVHPNINTATLGIAIGDFKKILASSGHDMKILET